MQAELFPPPSLNVSPAPGLSAPRLWIRRFVLWSEPGIVLREFELRPGLNIIWSPDPDDLGSRGDRRLVEGAGHAAGKTLVCRFLRYCLGETHFAPEAQQRKIAKAFKDGRAGIEVVLDGVVWAVVRSIGERSCDVVRERASLDDLDVDEAEATGMVPFFDAIARTILSPSVSKLLDDSPEKAWLMALAWLARDQECRLDKVTDWRAAASESGSPVRTLSDTGRTNVIRALLRAMTLDGRILDDEIESLRKAHEKAAREVERRPWVILYGIDRLAGALNLPAGTLPEDGPLAVAALRAEAEKNLKSGAVADVGGEPEDLADLGLQRDKVQAEVDRIVADIAKVEGERNTARVEATMAQSQLPGLSGNINQAENPYCKICDVPISRALAEGCGLSDRLQDVETLRQRQENLMRDLKGAQDRASVANETLSALAIQLDAANARLDPISHRFSEEIRRQDEYRKTEKARYAARRILDDVIDLEKLIQSNEEAKDAVAKLAGDLERKKATARAERERHVKVFDQLTGHFDPVVRRLLQKKGRIKHDGHGIHPEVVEGDEGDRSSTAIDSLKVIAFDLAVLCRSMEGATNLPPFLIHDSPREGDMGLSVYHGLFRLSVDLEKVGPAPLFQYIITTTTRPPDELSDKPWVCLTLHGTPAQERLLRQDL